MLSPRCVWLVLSALSLLVCIGGAFAAEPFKIRPDIHGDQIVFVAGGDLWTASLGQSESAKKLFQSPTLETDPHFSPDGKWVAFTGYLHGSANVYVVPSRGGDPRRLTYWSDRCLGWTPDGKVAFRSGEHNRIPDGEPLQTVSLNGETPTLTPILEVSAVGFGMNPALLYFTRFPNLAENMPGWRGGQLNRIGLFDFAKNTYRPLTSDKFNSIYPCPVGRDLYFLADQDSETLNLFRLNGGGITRLTDFKADGIRTLKTDGKRLVYERQGNVFVYDPASKKTTECRASIRAELSPLKKTIAVKDWVAEVDPSPDGKNVAYVSRGDIYLASTSEKSHVNITNSDGAKEESLTWSADGTKIAFVTDQRGQYEVAIFDLRSRRTQLVGVCGGQPSFLRWAQDGQGIFFLLDRRGFYWLDAKGASPKLVLRTEAWTNGFSVHPGGQWLAVSRIEANDQASLVLANRLTGKTVRVSDPLFDDKDCEFSADGKKLYFLSRREGRTRLGVSVRSLEPYGGIFALEIDLEKVDLSRLTLAGEDFIRRTRVLTLESGDLSGLRVTFDGKVRWRDDSTWKEYDPVTDMVSNLQTSPNGRGTWSTGWKAHAYQDQSDIVTSYEGGSESRISLEGVRREIDLRSEWQQIYRDVGRYYAEHFYDENLKGLDWPKIVARYNRIDRISTRSELNLLISRLIGGLRGSHNAIWGAGDTPAVPNGEDVAGLGGITSWDGKGVRIERIYPSRPDIVAYGQTLYSPLGSLNDSIKVGDYIVAVDGQPVDATHSLGVALLGKGSKTVRLEINSTPSRTAAKEYSVRTINSNGSLGYQDWVDRSREYVDRVSQGRVAYVHVFDTNIQGPSAFAQVYFSQWTRDAIIVDARWNRGGNLQSGMVESLMRMPYAVEKQRYGIASQDVRSITGPKVLLINETTASGGDLLAYEFKKRKAGTVVGTRTAGRMIGVHWLLTTIDGGQIATSESHNLDAQTLGEVGEGIGVSPDVNVDLDPALAAAGRDPQLEKALQIILRKLALKK